MSGPDQEFLREPFDLVGFAVGQIEFDDGGYGKQGRCSLLAYPCWRR